MKDPGAAGSLARAQALVAKYGSVKRMWGGSDGGYCMSGAIRKEDHAFPFGNHPLSTPAIAARNAVALVVEHPSITSFNDALETTRDDVFDVFDEAISLALYECTLEEAQEALDSVEMVVEVP